MTKTRSTFLLSTLLFSMGGFAKGEITPSIVLYQESSTAKDKTSPPAEDQDKQDQKGKAEKSPSDDRQPATVGPGPGRRRGQTQPPAANSGTAPQQPGQKSGQHGPGGTDKGEAQGGESAAPEPKGRSKPSPGARRSAKDPEKMILEFEASPIDLVVSTIMGELGYSYVIDPGVTGNVSLFTRGGVPKDQIFSYLERLLQMNGYGIVQESEEFFAIVPLAKITRIPGPVVHQPFGSRQKEEKEKSQGDQKKKDDPKGGGAAESERPQGETLGGPTGAGGVTARLAAPAGPATALPPPQEAATRRQAGLETLQASAAAQQIEGERGVITYIVPLNFIPSSEFIKMAQVYLSEGATVVDFAPSNILMITDFRRNIQQVLNLVNLLDTRYFDLNSIDLIPMRFNQAADVAEDLGKVFAPDDSAAGVRIVALERLNSILIVTHGPDVLTEVKKWIDRLDSPTTSSNIKTFIYQVENNTAENIATVLQELYSDGFGLPSSAGADSQEGDQAGANRQGQGNQRRDAGFLSDQEARRRGRGGAGQQGFGQSLGPSLRDRPDPSSGIRAVVSGNVKIIVNQFNNSLIIQAAEADYQYLLQTIRQLDVLPRQAIIEAEIYQVRLNDTLSYGVMAFLESRNQAADAGPSTRASIGGNVAGEFFATTRTIVGDTRQLRFLINALKVDTEVEILDAPRLLTVDGVQATMNIGAEIPVQTSSFSDPLQSGTTGFANQISFRPVGTTILVVPRISASGIVTMELSLEVSSSANTNADGGTNLTPTIIRSYIETTMICRDGQTVAIAGIISESEDLARNRVPILGDIPIIGALFGNTVKTKVRSELVFLITPRVIQTLPTAVEMTLDFKRALLNSYDYIEKKQSSREELIEKRRAEESEKKKDGGN